MQCNSTICSRFTRAIRSYTNHIIIEFSFFFFSSSSLLIKSWRCFRYFHYFYINIFRVVFHLNENRINIYMTNQMIITFNGVTKHMKIQFCQHKMNKAIILLYRHTEAIKSILNSINSMNFLFDTKNHKFVKVKYLSNQFFFWILCFSLRATQHRIAV